MTNAQIISQAAYRLMTEGKIGTTGRTVTVTMLDEEGNAYDKEIMEPESIHTFATWKKLGFRVKKGEHAVARITIWKYAAKKAEPSDDEPVKIGDAGRMFLKESCFFATSQVELA